MERAAAVEFEFRSIPGHDPLTDAACKGVVRGFHTEHRQTLSTGIAMLDAELPEGGLPVGCLTELTGRRAAGKLSLALFMLSCALARGEVAALLDPEGVSAPDLWSQPALEQLLVVRGGGTLAALRAADALLATGVFSLLVLDLPGRATIARTPGQCTGSLSTGSLSTGSLSTRSLTTAAFARLARATRNASSALIILSEWLPWRPEGLASLVELRLELHHTVDHIGTESTHSATPLEAVHVTITKSKRGGNGMSLRLDPSLLAGAER